MTPLPVPTSKTDTGMLHTLRSVIAEPTGLAVGAVTAALCAVLSFVLWDSLAWPSAAIREAIPTAACAGKTGVEATVCALRVAATPLAGPLALLVLAFVMRGALGAAVNAAKRRFPGSGALLAGVVATIAFGLSWAGSHTARPTEFGLLPQIVFPAVVGVATYAIGRWGPPLHRVLRMYFVGRDYIPRAFRMLLVIAVPIAASFWLAQGASAARGAANEQLVVLIGIAAGFLLIAPRPGSGAQP